MTKTLSLSLCEYQRESVLAKSCRNLGGTTCSIGVGVGVGGGLGVDYALGFVCQSADVIYINRR